MSQWDNPPTAAEYLANQNYWNDHNIINPKNGQLQSEYTTQPTEPLGSQPKGERPTASKGSTPGIKLEEKSGEIIANKGYDLEYLNDVQEKPSQNIAAGNGWAANIDGPKNPDYWIDGKIFDGYAPESNRYKTIRDGIKDKVKEGQTSNIVLNLDNINRGAEEVLEGLIKRPINGLGEIFIIKGDTLLHYHFK